MEEIRQIRELIDDLSTKIDKLDFSISPILSRDLTEQALELNNPIEEARLFTLLAYAIDSVAYAHLKSMGVDTGAHPIMKELERIKSYMNKVNTKTQEQKEIQEKHIIDKETAVRFIKASLSDISIKKTDSSSNDKPLGIKKSRHNGQIKKKKNKKQKKSA